MSDADILPFPPARSLITRQQIEAWAEEDRRRPLPPLNPDPTLPPAEQDPLPPRYVVDQGPGKPAFVQAHPDHRDPPGTIRWVVIQPDGRRTPPGARILGE